MLEKGECHDIDQDHQGADPNMRRDLMTVLNMVYDTDLDGTLSDSDRAQLLEDFTVRCEAMQARMLEDFDTDGDGELSELEHEAARAQVEADHEEMHSNMAGTCGPPPEDGQAPADGQAPPEGQKGDNGPPPSCFVDSLVAEFDLDGDGELSDSELATLQDTVRARILSGERFHGDV